MAKYSTTPKGAFHWAHVGTPDTTFKAEGQFHVKLQLAGQEAEDMRNAVDTAHANWKSEVNKTKGQKAYQEFLPYKVVLGDDGMESGIQFHFKMKASGVNSRTGQAFTQRPIVVGPDKTPLPTNIKIANGSTGKVAYEMAPYQFGSGLGIQLRLRGVQVLNLIEWNGDSADDSMFSVEDGYEVKVNIESNEKPNEAEEIFPDSSNGDF
tara:strand:- start:2219 stop:2842 length:624 start_codon:yes stop_codon:yes gene_type:complete